VSELRVEGIHTYYGDSHVLHGVSLRVAPGEVVALLGRNGAGKTTAIRSVAGFTPPRTGRVTLDGEAVQGWPAHRIARRGLALVPQGRRIFAPLTVRENLLLGARSRRARSGHRAAGWTLARIFDLFPRLRERQEQLGGTLSGGEQQMLAIGRALLTNGTMLMLDEPSEGLAPLIAREIGRIVRALPAEGLAVLLVEQNYHLALAAADRVYVMNKGAIVYEGTPATLEADEDVKRRYLGVA
jgi:branched-chain amino acid transport system ATP-binding protein